MFDTNIVVSALVFGGRLAWMRTVWAARIHPVVCSETVQDLTRVLTYPKFRLSHAERLMLLEDYLPFAEIVPLPQPLPVLPVACRDRDDAVFIQLAWAAECALVSGDKDLTVLRSAAPISILSAAEVRSISV